MRSARVAYAGAVHTAVPLLPEEGDTSLRLADGRVVREDQVVWLPPFEVGTIIALGLNYAEHAKELAFNAQEEPLVFLKNPNTLLGHRERETNTGAAGRLSVHALQYTDASGGSISVSTGGSIPSVGQG